MKNVEEIKKRLEELKPLLKDRFKVNLSVSLTPTLEEKRKRGATLTFW